VGEARRPLSSKKDLKARVVGLTIGCGESGPGSSRRPQSLLCLLGCQEPTYRPYSICPRRSAASLPVLGLAGGCLWELRGPRGAKGRQEGISSLPSREEQGHERRTSTSQSGLATSARSENPHLLDRSSAGLACLVRLQVGSSQRAGSAVLCGVDQLERCPGCGLNSAQRDHLK
jgi:hypothetical protein